MLRSGYTTGSCAAAAAKAAITLLITKQVEQVVTIPMPDGSRASFQVYKCSFIDKLRTVARASIIKDAGDDPDVTNNAEIVATVKNLYSSKSSDDPIIISGGVGVGKVTKRGLAVKVGEDAINPVPRKMIKDATLEVIRQKNKPGIFSVEISVPHGVEISKKTLNERLGIIGGISILGTTGIVKPISTEAWTATVSTSMNVAKNAGIKEIVISTGRTSEKAIQDNHDYLDEAYVMMGDFLDFTLFEAKKFEFQSLHYAGMWAKLLKGAMGQENTHVDYGILGVEQICPFFRKNGVEENVVNLISNSNSAREVYDILYTNDRYDVIELICRLAKEIFQKKSGLPVNVSLINTEKKVVYSC